MTGLRRRHLLAAGLGIAAVPIASCNAQEPTGPLPPGGTAVRNIRDFGAVGDGKADDTAALAEACRTDGPPPVVYLPAGDYKVTAFPELPDFAVVYGDGADVTTVFCETDTTLVTLRNKQRVRFARMGFYLTGPEATAITLTECFRCSFDTVLIRGNHLSDNFPRYAEQRGVVLEANTGGTSFVDCDINNFGIGLSTSCIQNYVTSSKFTSNRIGVLGVGTPEHSAGLSITNSEFVSDIDPGTTDRHLLIDGPAANWWLTNVWFEGSEVAVQVGVAGRGGPAQFGMINCKVAGRAACVELIHCRQPYLANIAFDPDPGHSPTELRIDPGGCPEGTAVNLISSAGEDMDSRVFPNHWQVIGRGRIHQPTFTGTVTTQGAGEAEILRARSHDGTTVASVLASGAYVSDRADAGMVLRDGEGGYWRLVVSPSGALTTAPLGKNRPAG